MSGGPAGVRDVVIRRLRLEAKHLYQFARYPSPTKKRPLFIVGCQRSGTTLVTKIFERDLATRVYPEVSKLSSRDVPKYLRLNPFAEVEKEIAAVHADLVVLKPLVESQNTIDMLDYFGGNAIWMYRDYRSVASSIIVKWGLQHPASDLASIVEQKKNWRTEKVPESLRDLVLKFYDPNMDPYVAATLYWYVRNSFAISQQLDRDSRVIFCRYENLVNEPTAEMRRIYRSLDRKFPGESVVSDIETRSTRNPPSFDLPPELEARYEALLEWLDGHIQN